MPRRGTAHGHRPTYWWNEDIAEQRRKCIAKRRIYQRRGRVTADREAERSDYLEAKKVLRTAIKQSQERAWAELVASVEGEVWGLPYRLVTKKLARYPKNAYMKGREEEIASHLFPRAPTTKWDEIPLTGPRGFPILQLDDEPTRPLEAAELIRASKKLPSGKAPGPDNKHNEVIKIFVKEDPEAILALFDLCWRSAVFPRRWKRARLVLLFKGGSRLHSDPGSFRPISLVKAVAKLYERMILQRLEAKLSESGGLSIRQFGFRKGVGIIDAIGHVLELAEEYKRYKDCRTCVVIASDVANAFNTAAWPAIDEAIRGRGISRRMVRLIREYMSDRFIQVNMEGSETLTMPV